MVNKRNPAPFNLTSQPGDGAYQSFLVNETRYSSLARKSPDRAKLSFPDPKKPPSNASGIIHFSFRPCLTNLTKFFVTKIFVSYCAPSVSMLLSVSAP